MGFPGFVKPTKKKIIILVILVAAVLLGINFFGRPKQAALQFTVVKREDIKTTVSSSGTLSGKNSANLRFKTPGKLLYVNVKTGDRVFTGQVIAGLDTASLSITLQQAQNTLRDKQATADKVLDDIHLFQYGNGGFASVGTSSETMTQRQLRTSAEAARDNAFDSVKTSQRDFQDMVIISPIGGIITQAIAVPNQLVTVSDLIAQVVDTSSIYFDTDVDEADITSLSVGQKSEITLDAYPDKVFKGSVDQIIPQTKTTSSGATIVTARIKLDNPELVFINGLGGQASVIISERKGTLVIPQEALREDNNVLIETQVGISPRKVLPGIRSDTNVEILEGLSEGDKILLNPPSSGLPNRNRSPLGGFLRSLVRGR